jgi:hypothetical protein
LDTFIIGFIVGSTLAIVGDYLVRKYLAKVEARIKTEVVAAEALKPFDMPGAAPTSGRSSNQ